MPIARWRLFSDRKLSPGNHILTSDCLAGNRAASVYQRGALSKNDIKEGPREIASLSRTHKSAIDHAALFLTGYNHGRFGVCPGFGG